MRIRIKSLDGLRALAALGVLWIHTWSMFKNPRFYLGSLDIADVLALGGNGVDLFFVISGFCMYFFYSNKAFFGFSQFMSFLKKRFKRLSPAFYVISLMYTLWYLYQHQALNLLENIINTVTYSVFTNNFVAPHFWTLAVEWQFYLIVPFILYFQRFIGFKKIFYFFLVFFLVLAVVLTIKLKEGSDIYTNQIMFRYVEFASGIYVAFLTLNGKFIKQKRIVYFILFVLITYIGRISISAYALSLLPHYYNLLKVIGFTLMGLGFSGILSLAINSKNGLNRFLGHKTLAYIGKISYSFYLLHTLVQYLVGWWLVEKLSSLAIPVFFKIFTVFCVCTIILVPLSAISYKLLETPYLRKRVKVKRMVLEN